MTDLVPITGGLRLVAGTGSTCPVHTPSSDPEASARETFDGMLANMVLSADIAEARHALSPTAMAALDRAYSPDPGRMHPSTRGCLIRRGVLDEDGTVTLFGRRVVDDSRRAAAWFESHRAEHEAKLAEVQARCAAMGLTLRMAGGR